MTGSGRGLFKTPPVVPIGNYKNQDNGEVRFCVCVCARAVCVRACGVWLCGACVWWVWRVCGVWCVCACVVCVCPRIGSTNCTV
jgi:hypothetical protein